MSLIEWKDEFSVGVTEVDLEHRDLIDLINDLHAVMGAGATHDKVVDTLGEITHRSRHTSRSKKNSCVTRNIPRTHRTKKITNRCSMSFATLWIA